ncbi:MAG: magnesium transporter, partial [Solirubrobacterales bacterium]|nr:magnesium transporter [Solirubrobacterales bacterium]
CGGPVDRPAGPMTVQGLRAPLVVDRLRLTDGAQGRSPAGPVEADGSPGDGQSGAGATGDPASEDAQVVTSVPELPAVTDTGRAGNGERTGASVATTVPAYIVLGESYSEGWHATCDGRDLGPAVPRQGYANAWRVETPGCRRLDLAFVPNDLLAPARWISMLGVALLVLLLLTGPRREGRREASRDVGGSSSELPYGALERDPPGVGRVAVENPVLAAAERVAAAYVPRARPVAGREATAATSDAPLLAEAGPEPVPLRRALAVGLACGLVLGFVFALRAGAVLGPVIALILWRAVPTRTLVLTAGGLLGLAVPLLYALFPGKNRGGFSTTYATDHLAAHWVAVGAVGLLLVALARGLRSVLADGRAPEEQGPRR